MKIGDLKSGDLLYWRGKGFYSWLVRWATRDNFWKFWTQAPYSHVAVYWANGSGEQYIESYPKIGVRIRYLTDELPEFAQHTHTGFGINAFQAKVTPMIGRPYSYFTALMTMLGLAGDGTSSFVCSELAQYLLRELGWDWKGEKYHPYGLAKAVTRSNPEFTVEPLEV